MERVDVLSAEGLRRRVWLSQIARYSAVCFPLPPVTVYLTRITRCPLKGRPCSTSSVQPLLGYAECRAQMCLQSRILGEIISSLSDLLLPYTPALGSGSHQQMLSVKTFCLEGLKTQMRPSARKTFFLISIFRFNFEARKRKKQAPSENLKRHTSVSWCQDYFSLVGKNEELQSIKYTMATHYTVHQHTALNSCSLLWYNGKHQQKMPNFRVCFKLCSSSLYSSVLCTSCLFHQSTYWWLVLFVLWQHFFFPTFCL